MAYRGKNFGGIGIACAALFCGVAQASVQHSVPIAMPEPRTLALMGGGLLCVGLFRWKRRIFLIVASGVLAGVCLGASLKVQPRLSAPDNPCSIAASDSWTD